MLPFMAGDFVTLFLNGKNKVIKLSKDFQYGIMYLAMIQTK